MIINNNKGSFFIDIIVAVMLASLLCIATYNMLSSAYLTKHKNNTKLMVLNDISRVIEEIYGEEDWSKLENKKTFKYNNQEIEVKISEENIDEINNVSYILLAVKSSDKELENIKNSIKIDKEYKLEKAIINKDT